MGAAGPSAPPRSEPGSRVVAAKRVSEAELGTCPQARCPCSRDPVTISQLFDIFPLERTAKCRKALKGKKNHPLSCHPEATVISTLECFFPQPFFSAEFFFSFKHNSRPRYKYNCISCRECWFTLRMPELFAGLLHFISSKKPWALGPLSFPPLHPQRGTWHLAGSR